MSTALALRLISSGAVSAADAEAALITSLARRVPFVRALIDSGAVGEAALDSFLEQLGGIGLRQFAGMPELVNRLPPHFCRRMGVLPVRVDHAARIVEVAAADPLDPHIAAEVAFHLGVPARVVRAPIAAIEEAIRRIELEAQAAAGRARRATPPFPHGAPESSNPPPPPPEPAPIPLLRRTGERSPDTLRLYKQTLRPGEKRTDLDFNDAATVASDRSPDSLPLPLSHAKAWDADSAEDSAPPKTLRDSGRLRDPANQASGQPRATGDSGRIRDIAKQITLEPSRAVRDATRDATPNLRELGRQASAEPAPTPRDSVLNLRELGRQVSGEAGRALRDSVPDLRELGRRATGDTARPPLKDSVPNLRELAEQLTNDAAPKTVRDSGRLRDIAQQASREPPRSTRDSTRLRDIVDPPPPMDRLRDSTRLRDLVATVTREGAAPPPEGADDPLSSIVPAEQAPPPGEPPAVSFPSMPPPSILEQPALLAADTEWTGPMPSAEQKPDAPTRKERKPSRFARPAIDIQIPQPPSENRARRQRSTWDVQYGAGEPQDEPSTGDTPEPVRIAEPARAPEPTLQAPMRPDLLDTSAVLEALRGAGSRDDVVVAALRGLRTVGRRAAIFVVRRDGFHGWACNVELGDLEKLRAVSVPSDAPSLFATAVAAGSYFGPVPSNAAHAALLAVLEHPSSDVAVAVARAGGKPVMLLFADDLVDVKRRVLPRLLEIADAVGASLSRLLAARL